MNDDLISRRKAIDATWEEPSYADPINVLTEVRDRIKALPSALPDTSRIENILHGKSAEEQYDFLWWLMQDYGMQFTDTRSAVIEWLRGERNG